MLPDAHRVWCRRAQAGLGVAGEPGGEQARELLRVHAAPGRLHHLPLEVALQLRLAAPAQQPTPVRPPPATTRCRGQLAGVRL